MDVMTPKELEPLHGIGAEASEDAATALRFDRIVALACELFRVPAAMVLLTERDQQWIKAADDIVGGTVPGDHPLLSEALAGSAPLIVADTMLDDRFSDCRLAPGRAPVRFFAGLPLIVDSDGAAGLLCLMDRQPRTLSERERGLMTEMSLIITDRLRLHRSKRALESELARRRAIQAVVKRQKQKLWKQERLLQQSSRLARIGGWEYHTGTGRIQWSDEVYRIHELPFSYEPQLEDLADFYPGPARETYRSVVESALAEGRGFEVELPFVTAKGNDRWVRIVGEVQRQDSRVVRIFGSLQDVTEQRRAEQRIEFLARYDPLTSLPNRTVFQALLEELLAGDEGPLSALALIDVDHFKDINDSLGHQAGDALIQEIAQRICAACRGCDHVARVGGDEFAVIFRNVRSKEHVGELAAGLLAALSRPHCHNGSQIEVSASIGLVLCPGGGGKPQDLFRNADIALYSAKAEGRNCYVFFDDAMRQEVEHRQGVLAAIRTALADGELTPFYQPIISLKDGSLMAFEALLRWHQEGGIAAAPGAYRAALQDPGLSDQIGDHVIGAVVRQIAEWERKGLDGFRVGINLATSQFRGSKLTDIVCGQLDAHGVDGRRLAMEVTETVLLSRRPDEIAETLAELQKLGIRIALDDFGTGYASLTHLRDFPVDTIKIDRSFVLSLLTSRESHTIVEAIINLSRGLGKRTTAEGVETVEVGRRLRRLGCECAQGYGLGRPMPAPQVERFIARLRAAGGPGAPRLKTAG